ncbi:MAG: T9SS type A sorting domain-containing protein [Bacteroidales bacterium]|jgi:M6 family metalloprotease-like protein|nr:T9SS type A sorting domain-containing protein [Bacteroidales bacterium]
MKKHFLLIFCISFLLGNVQASYEKNIPQTLQQPNGEIIHCFASGDEYYNYLHDKDGYTIIQNPATGYYVYAQKEGNLVVPSPYIVGSVHPSIVGLTPNVNITPEEMLAIRHEKSRFLDSLQHTHLSRGPNKGNFNNIVIFIRFQDQTEFPTPFSTVNSKFNDSTANAVSMFNYFKATSYNTLFLRASFYPQPNGNAIVSYQDIYPRNYFLPYSEANPDGYSETARTGREAALLQRAITAIQNLVPANLNIDYDLDGNVDNIVFVVRGASGGWSDLLWSHRSSLYSVNVQLHGKRVWDYNFVMDDGGLSTSTLCHEMFHTLSAPDLYHYDYGLDAVGSWDLMCANASVPQHSGAYMKLKYGKWIDNIPEINTAGTYSIKPIGGTSNDNVCYKILTAQPSIFYVLEYRYKGIFFESGIPGSGLLVYRIFQNCNYGNPCDGNAAYNDISIFDEVYIFRPGGNYYIDGMGYYRLNQGTINQANFSSTNGRTAMNPTTNPFPFYPERDQELEKWVYTIGALDIANIVEFAGDSIQFTYNTPNYVNVSEEHIELPNLPGASHTINISSNTSWYTYSNNGSWYHLNLPTGQGNQTVTISVIGYNNSAEPRYDTLRFYGAGASVKNVYISQPGFSFSISDTLVEMYKLASSTTINLTAAGNWMSLAHGCNWLTVSPTSGTGSTEITLSVTELTSGNERICQIPFLSASNMIVVTVVQKNTLSVNDNKDYNISIYPNPTDNRIFIENKNSNLFIKKIAVFDLTGKLIREEECYTSNANIDLTDAKSGFYLLHLLFNNDIQKIYKVIKR